MLKTLAAHDINIEYGYSSGGPGDEKAMVFVPSDIASALAALGELNA